MNDYGELPRENHFQSAWTEFRDAMGDVGEQYADLCDALASAVMRSATNIVRAVDAGIHDIGDAAAAVFAVPIAVFLFIVKLIGWIFNLLLLPFRLIASYPVLIIVLVTILLISGYLIHRGWRRITAQRLVQWFMNLLPHLATGLYSILTICFPQVGAFFRAVSAIITPIQWMYQFVLALLGRGTMPRRPPPRPSSRSTSSRSPRSTPSNRSYRSRHEEQDEDDEDEDDNVSARTRSHSERMLCCEKSVLLRPCNHLCVCADCAYRLVRAGDRLCPLCRAPFTTYDEVYL